VRAQGVGCRVKGGEALGCRVQGVRFRVEGVGIQGLGCRVQGVGLRVKRGVGFRVWGVECRM